MFKLERELNNTLKLFGEDSLLTISDITRAIRKDKQLTDKINKMLDKLEKEEKKENG